MEGGTSYTSFLSSRIGVQSTRFMRPFLYAFPCSAVVLFCLLIWRLAKRRLWFYYPYVSIFIVYRFLADVALFPIVRYRPDWFAAAYWRLETITLAMQFLINWEFFRGLFSQPSTTRRLARRLLLTVELGILPAILVLSWSQASLFQDLHLPLSPVVEQYLCLVQASLLLIPAAVAWYYRIPLGRNLRGLSLGFGVYLLVRAVNFASLQAFHGFALYWRMLTPMTFIIMIAVWLWAFWEYAGTPTEVSLDEAVHSPWKMEWQFLWSRAMARLRRGIE